MDLTPEMIGSVVNGTKNVTSYSYEIAVKGTVVDGIAGMIAMLFGIIMAVITAKYCWKWYKNYQPDRSGMGREGAAIWSIIAVIFMGLSSAFVFDILFHQYLMCIMAPEYVVIDKVLSGTISILS